MEAGTRRRRARAMTSTAPRARRHPETKKPGARTPGPRRPRRRREATKRGATSRPGVEGSERRGRRARARACAAPKRRGGGVRRRAAPAFWGLNQIAAREIFQLDGGGSTFGPKFFTSPRRAPRVPRRAARQGIRAPGGVEAVVRRVVATLRSRPEAGSVTRLSRPGDDSCFSKEEKNTSGRRALGLPKRFLAAAPRRTSRPARCRPTTARPRAARRSPRSRPGRPRRRGASRTTSPCSIRSRRSSSSWSPSSNERRSSSPGSSAATTGVAA